MTKVLLAEDSVAMRAAACHILRDAGYEVAEAADGEMALEAACASPPDVVLLDIEMPGLDGFGVLRELRAHPVLSEVPVIFLTGRAEGKDVAAGLAGGAHDYLRKPVDRQELVARVAAAARTKALQDQLRHQKKELERMAWTDCLTGLFNRRSVQVQLDQHHCRSVRHGHDLSVALVDIDRFKRINDSLGHPAGDQVLAELARLLSNRLRGSDVLGRWGGEEFVVLMPDTEAAGALRASELLREAVEHRPFLYKGEPLAVTVSVGVATWSENVSAPELVRQADAALYEAKRCGRNRVAAATKKTFSGPDAPGAAVAGTNPAT